MWLSCQWIWFIFLLDKSFDFSISNGDTILLSKNKSSYWLFTMGFNYFWISSTICRFSQFMVQNRSLNCLSVRLAVNFSCIKLGIFISSTTYSYHWTRIVLYVHSFYCMGWPIYICSLLTSYNKRFFLLWILSIIDM
jgi:hypothetical protein